MLSQEEEKIVLSTFPNIKLSYENITHKKVYNSDYIVAIPEGKKCFVWFTIYNKKNMCFIIEITKIKKNIKMENITAPNEYYRGIGTIFYGTCFQHSTNEVFSIEDIFCYKGFNTSRENWENKLKKITIIFKNDFRNKLNSNVKFGLPLMSTTIEDLNNKISKVTYQIHSIQFKLFINDHTVFNFSRTTSCSV
jgi:hypothetical protein